MFSRGRIKRFGEMQNSVVNIILHTRNWELEGENSRPVFLLYFFTFLLHICAKVISVFSETASLIRKWRAKLNTRSPPEL